MKIKKMAVFLLLFALLAVPFSVAVSADSPEEVPYPSYTYWTDGQNREAVECKPLFIPERRLSGQSLGVGKFGTLDYIFAFGENLYVLDGASGRILVLDKDYAPVRVIEGFVYQGETLTFAGATGLFVDESGLYVADTENKRVLCTDFESVTAIITLPESTLIPENYDFAPIRLVRDSNGYLYVLCKGSYYGMMLFSDQYEFLGFYGASTVQNSAADAIADWLESLFETEEKHSASIQALPFQLVDVAMDPDGFIITLSDQSTGQLKRFGTNGSNILQYRNQFESVSADSLNFADQPSSYQDLSGRYSGWVVEKLVALTADDEGYMYLVDSTQGRIFMYDTECQLICVFGGGLGNGNQVGTFITPNAVACLDGDLLVSDALTKEITVFSLSEYGRWIKTANSLSNQGKWEEALPYWENVQAVDQNCQLAWRGMAQAALSAGEYTQAMELAETALDRVTYASAFKVVRDQFISRNFVWLFLAVALAAGGVLYLIQLTHKRNVVFIRNASLRTGLTACIHPFRSFGEMRDYRRLSIPLATILLALYYVSTVTGELGGSFMYASMDTAGFNAIYTLLGTVGVVLLYVIVNWAVCVLCTGRGRLVDIYCSTCYCLTPMILYQFLYLILSYTTVATSNAGFGLLPAIFQLYTILLVLIAMTAIQDFTFFKSIGIAIVTVIGMCIAAFILFIMLSLGQDAIGFIVSIINEITMR